MKHKSKKSSRSSQPLVVNPFAEWLRQNLFNYLDFENKFFPYEVEIYSDPNCSSIPTHFRQMSEQFTTEDLYGAIMKACGVYKMQRDAVWFHVNIVDLAVWVLEDYKPYPYPLLYPETPLSTLFVRMEKYSADQGGVTYLGLLSENRKWLLLLEHGANFEGADFKIRFFGPDYLCKTVRSFVKTKSA